MLHFFVHLLYFSECASGPLCLFLEDCLQRLLAACRDGGLMEGFSASGRLVPLFSQEGEPVLTPTVPYSPQPPVSPAAAAITPTHPPRDSTDTPVTAAATPTHPQPASPAAEPPAVDAAGLPGLPDSSDDGVRTDGSVASCLLAPPPQKCAVPAGGQAAPSGRASILGPGPARAAFRARAGAEGDAAGFDSRDAA